MPTKDYLWKKANTKMYGLRITNSSGIPAAVKAYAEDHNMTETGVCVAAVKEKLEREGYWQGGTKQNPVYSGPHGRIVK